MGGGGRGLKRTGKITLPSSFPSSNWPAGHSFLSTFFDVQRRLAALGLPPMYRLRVSIPPFLSLARLPRVFLHKYFPLLPLPPLHHAPRFAFFLTYFALFHSTECSFSLSPRLVFVGSVRPDLRAVFPFEAAAVAEYSSVTCRETVRHYHHLV